MQLLSLPEDILDAVAQHAGLVGEARLGGACRELWARSRNKRAGVSLADLAPTLSTGGVYARFGKDVRPLLAAVAFEKAGNARRYATVDVLAALLRAYDGWPGLKKHLDAPAERAAAVAEKEELAFHTAAVQLQEFVAASSKIPADGFFAWIEASRADGMGSPAERPETRAFLTGKPKRPPFSRVRSELEFYAAVQRSCRERRALLNAELKPYGLADMSDNWLYRQFCSVGPVEQVSRVARELARMRGLC